MAIIALPDSAGIKSLSLEVDVPAQVNRSDWTKRRQVVTQPGPSMWSGTADLVVKVGEANMLEIEAFLVDLEGPINSFRLKMCENPQFSGSRSVVVDGAGQSGRTLNLRGGVNGDVLKRGFKITVDEQCLMVMAPVTFGSDGKVTVTFKPSLRVPPADGATAEIVEPTVLLSLTGSSTGWQVDPGQQYTVKQLALEEAL